MHDLIKHQINCNHQDHTYKEYWSVKISKDDPLLLEAKKIGEDTHANYNPNDPSGKSRSEPNKKNNVIYGKLAELVLREILSDEIKSRHVKASILESKDEYGFDYDVHSDIEVIANGEPFIIEVRSSFPYRPIPEAIEYHFDILGWYTTSSKPYEKPKDFYLRVLFPFGKAKQSENLQNGFVLYFVGGATSELLNSSKGGWNNLKQPGARYRTIKPICKGYDARQILDEMFPNAKPEDFAGT